MSQWPSYTQTRYRYLGVSQTGRIWRYVCLDFEGGGTKPDAPALIGPQFRTKLEAFAQLPAYATANYPEIAE